MAAIQILLADLKARRCSKTSEVRLLRFWEARNVRKGGQLMSIDMLFVDKNGTLAQGSVSVNRQARFRERLRQGSIYNLSGFDVVRSSPNFRLCNSPHSIRFNDATLLDECPMSLSAIPKEVFSFMPYSKILELGNTGKQLPDIMGEVETIRSTITDGIAGTQRVMLTLRLPSGEDVTVSLFESMAVAFHAKSDIHGKEPRIVIATSVNPKIVGGRLYLNATSATHLFFDDETEAGKTSFQTLPQHGGSESVSPTKVVHAQKIEPMTLSELNNFIMTADPQIIEFLCTAKVTGIDEDEGWCYIGCSRCAKKLVREISSFTCVLCNLTNAVASLRYRVVLSDNTDTASFVGFDLEMAKLTNLQASDAGQIQGNGVDAQVSTALPPSLTAIIGRTYTFQLRLRDLNFSSKHETFTISRIFPDRVLAPMPAFEEIGGNPADAVDKALATGTSTVVEQTNNTDSEKNIMLFLS